MSEAREVQRTPEEFGKKSNKKGGYIDHYVAVVAIGSDLKNPNQLYSAELVFPDSCPIRAVLDLCQEELEQQNKTDVSVIRLNIRTNRAKLAGRLLWNGVDE